MKTEKKRLRHLKKIVGLMSIALLLMGCSLWENKTYTQNSSHRISQESMQQFMNSVRTKNSGNAESHYELGRHFQSRGKYAMALKEFWQAASIDPGRPEYYNAIGVCYDSLKEYALAVMSYRWALDLRPDFPEAHNNLGYSYYLQGNLELARTELMKAVSLDASNPRYLNNLSLAYKQAVDKDTLLALATAAENPDITPSTIPAPTRERTAIADASDETTDTPAVRQDIVSTDMTPSTTPVLPQEPPLVADASDATSETPSVRQDITSTDMSPSTTPVLPQEPTEVADASDAASETPAVRQAITSTGMTPPTTPVLPREPTVVADASDAASETPAVRQDIVSTDMTPSTPPVLPREPTEVADASDAIEAPVVRQDIVSTDMTPSTPSVLPREPPLVADASDATSETPSVRQDITSTDMSPSTTPVLPREPTEVADASDETNDAPEVWQDITTTVEVHRDVLMVEAPVAAEVSETQESEIDINRVEGALIAVNASGRAIPQTVSTPPLIEISNGNGVYRMARNLGRYFRAKGFNVVRLTNADNFNHSTTSIDYGDGCRNSADYMAQIIFGTESNAQYIQNGNAVGKIKLVLGKDIENLNQIFAGGLPIVVANGNGVNGMAARVSSVLNQKGFSLMRPINAEHFNFEETCVYYPDGRIACAEFVGRELPGQADVKYAARNGSSTFIKIVIGKDLYI